jgi:hypothetical protein
MAKIRQLPKGIQKAVKLARQARDTAIGLLPK